MGCEEGGELVRRAQAGVSALQRPPGTGGGEARLPPPLARNLEFSAPREPSGGIFSTLWLPEQMEMALC